MSVMNDIRIALENHLATMVPPPPAVAWPNVPFTRQEGQTFLVIDFQPLVRRPSTVGTDPEQRVSGQFFITVYTPEAQGASEGMLLADALLIRFNGASAVIAPKVVVRLEYSEVKRALHDPPFFAIPVEIGWYAYSRP